MMFTKKNWEEHFPWMQFQEHPFVDFKKNQEVALFDVSTKAFPDYASDFMNGQSFDHKNYCICLLAKIGELPIDGMPDFLKHQYDQVKDPLEWLYKFDELLSVVDKFDLIKEWRIRFKIMKDFIGYETEEIPSVTAETMKGSSHSFAELYSFKREFENMKFGVIMQMKVSDQISYFEQLRVNYFEKIKGASKKDRLIKFIDTYLVGLGKIASASELERPRLTFKGTVVQLTKVYGIMMKLKTRDGEPVVSFGNIDATAKIISDHYYNSKGVLFKASIIRTGLPTKGELEKIHGKKK